MTHYASRGHIPNSPGDVMDGKSAWWEVSIRVSSNYWSTKVNSINKRFVRSKVDLERCSMSCFNSRNDARYPVLTAGRNDARCPVLTAFRFVLFLLVKPALSGLLWITVTGSQRNATTKVQMFSCLTDQSCGPDRKLHNPNSICSCRR